MKNFKRIITDDVNHNTVDTWKISTCKKVANFVSIGVHIGIKFYEEEESLNPKYANKFAIDLQYDYISPEVIGSVKRPYNRGTYGVNLFADTMEGAIELCEAFLLDRFPGVNIYNIVKGKTRTTILEYEGDISRYDLAKASWFHSAAGGVRTDLSDAYKGVSDEDFGVFDALGLKFTNAQNADNKYCTKLATLFFKEFGFHSIECFSRGLNFDLHIFREKAGLADVTVRDLKEYLTPRQLKLMRKVSTNYCMLPVEAVIEESVVELSAEDKTIAECTIVDRVVILPAGQLDRGTYTKVKKRLENIGGKWNTQKKGFVFSDKADIPTLLGRVKSGEKVNIKKEFQFFATPNSLAKRMVELADIKKGESVLEPSAGDGAIARELLKTDGAVDCIEYMEENYLKLLEIKGLNKMNVKHGDFLTSNYENCYNKIIGNPPFSKNQDIDHVNHMYKCTAPGGRIVTIMSQSWLNSKQKKQVAFKEWLNSLGATIEKIDQGEFKESGTNVATTLVIINKPL